MATELRWILAALSAVLLAGIWWWGERRSRQAAGDAMLAREATPHVEPAPPAVSPGVGREWGVSPLEPLSIRTADFDAVPVDHRPMTAHAQTVDSPGPPATAPAADAMDAARVVTVRVSAKGDRRWPGLELRAALEQHGMTHGRYQVFHRTSGDGRTLFCAASLAEPGTFDLARMADEEYRGVTLFAVLPGPLEPLKLLGAVIEAAHDLAATLHGTVQDATGAPLSQQRAEALIDEVLQFQVSQAPQPAP